MTRSTALIERAPAEPARASAPVAGPSGAPVPGRRRRARAALAALALLLVYVGLSFLDDPRASLGSDTGAKVATLRVMDEHNSLVPDVGYWAERYDPRGNVHPLYNSAHIDGHWVNVTTIPMLELAYPLYKLGGDRAILLLPMLGGLLAAFAARALARRLGSGDGWIAFWAVGLATPVAVYALDFWEHSLGVAAMAWAVVFVLDVIQKRAGWRGALVAGALFGLAATMRTEALIYALVSIALVGVAGVRGSSRRPVSALAGIGAAFMVGLGALVFANEALERVIVGGALRSGRASATAGDAAGSLMKRVTEAFTTTFGLTRFPNGGEWFLGGVLVIAIAVAAYALVKRDDRSRRIASVAIITTAFVYVLRFSTGLGFVPGMLTASPLAIAGIVLWRRNTATRWIVAIALGALPLVWVFQYSGGAGPQWGGRYMLVSGVLLAIAGVVALRNRVALGVFLTAGVLVSACGVAWLSARTHAVADSFDYLAARDDSVLISRERFLLREGGAFYTPELRWLLAASGRDLVQAFRVAGEAGYDEAALIQAPERPRPRELAGFSRGATERIDFFPNTPVTVTTYRRHP
jgi:hypothetical protein